MSTPPLRYETFAAFSPYSDIGPHRAVDYWIVNPATQLFEFLLNEASRFVVGSPANDQYQSPRLPEAKLQLAGFWHEVDQRLA